MFTDDAVGSDKAVDYDFLTIRDTSIITNKNRVIKTLAAPSYTANTKGTLRIHLVEYSAKYEVELSFGGTAYRCTLDTKAGDTAANRRLQRIQAEIQSQGGLTLGAAKKGDEVTGLIEN